MASSTPTNLASVDDQVLSFCLLDIETTEPLPKVRCVTSVTSHAGVYGK
jgi:hypothetical protein